MFGRKMLDNICRMKVAKRCFWAGVTLAGLGSTLFAQTSTSKLSAHLINTYTVGSSNIVAGRPRTLKVLGLDSGFPSGMVQAMRDYKARVPSGKLLVRIYSPKTYSLADDATVSAGDFWTNILQQALNSISPSDRALIDYLEGPNEGQTPTLGYPGNAPLQASQWFNQFWTNLTPRIVAAGYKPCIGSIAVGNPGGTTSEMQSYLAAFVPALRQSKAAGGAWSYHAYTINYTTDIATEIWYSLRYRQFYSYFATAFSDLNTMPLILTEGGVDFSGDPNTSGWQARGSQTDYEIWLNWFDGQMQRDPYLLGCTLFENGDPGGWSSFDLEPLAGWFKNYLSPTNVPPPPGNVAAVVGNALVTLSWTNPPVSPMTWTVKRSTVNGGPYSLIASNLTEAFWRDASFVPNVTYYYAVSAVNAFGESPNSAQVSTRPTNGLPDVVVTSVSWTPNNVLVGSNMVFKVTVQNRGSAATPTGVTLGVGFNLDGAGTVSWSSAYSSALAPNASVMLTADGGPSGVNYWTATSGQHTVVATVDDINRFPESIEDNNATNVSFTIVYPAPKITGFGVNNGSAILNWQTEVGASYQVQYKNDLRETNWSNLGNSIVASGNSLSITNGIGGAGQRYYRIVVN
jgi:hypothetical protein